MQNMSNLDDFHLKKHKRFLFNTQFSWLESPLDYTIAKAMVLRGHDILMVACGGISSYCEQRLHYNVKPPSCEECFKKVRSDFNKFGLPFLAMSDAINSEDQKIANEHLQSIVVHDLLDFEFKGIPLGKIAWFNLTKYYFAYPFEINRSYEKVLRRILHAGVMMTIAKERIFNQYQPDMVVTVNGKLLQWAPFVYLAKKYQIPFVTWEAARWGTTLVALNEIAHERRIDSIWESESKKPLTKESRKKVLSHFKLWEESKNTPLIYHDNETVDNDLDNIRKKLKLRPSTPVVTLFPNTVIDSAEMSIDSAFDSMFDWLFKIVDYAKKRSDLEFVIRAHPGEVKGPEKIKWLENNSPVCDVIRQRYSPLPPNLKLIDGNSPISSYALSKISDVVMVYASTLGIELALKGTLIWLAANPYYAGKGFTLDLSSQKHMEELLDQNHFANFLEPNQIELAERFAYIVTFRRPFALPYFDGKSGRFSPPSMNVFAQGGNQVIDNLSSYILTGKPFLDIGKTAKSSNEYQLQEGMDTQSFHSKYQSARKTDQEKRICLQPISRVFGLDRGTSICRYYIEKFLTKNAQFIHGQILEIGDNSYTKKFGSNVATSDVLNVVPSSLTTIVGNLETGENIPESTFDCIIMTQTIQVIYDVKSTLRNAFKALKPGGVLLLTASGISQISRYDMDRWGEYWRFTDKSLNILLSEVFQNDKTCIETYGNVVSAKSYLDGVAAEELSIEELDYQDIDYQLLITAQSCKPRNYQKYSKITPQVDLKSNPIVPTCEQTYKKIFADEDFQNVKAQAMVSRFGHWEVKFLGLTIRCHDLLSFYISAKDIFLNKIYNFNFSGSVPKVIDGGGHIGLFTLFIKQKYPRARITVFEPDPDAFKLLTYNLDINGFKDIQLVQAGLYKNKGEISFCSKKSDGSSIFAFSKNTSIYVHRLSEYLDSHIDFLKLNIEGAELDVILEIKHKLSFISEMVIEYHGFPEIGQNLHKILSILDQAGFRYMIHDFDSETNPATKPPFKLNDQTKFYLLIHAKKTPGLIEKRSQEIIGNKRIQTQSKKQDTCSKGPFGKPLILLYHRVAEEVIDAQLLAVSPKNFEEQIRVIVKNYTVLPLYELLLKTNNGNLCPDTVAITFDDGYLDVLTNAVPILEKYDAHATVFVASGLVGASKGFWGDTVERIFLNGLNLPHVLSLTNSTTNNLTWDLQTPQGRLKAHDEIRSLLRSKNFKEINEFMDGLIKWAGFDSDIKTIRPVVDLSQLKQMAASPVIEIGSHIVTHTKLSILTPEKQREEIRNSKKQLESWIGKSVRLLSYPYGTTDDFTAETKKISAQEGYFAGIANIQGHLEIPLDLFAVPRRLVRNWPGKRFAGWMKENDMNKLEVETLSNRNRALVEEQVLSNKNVNYCSFSKLKTTNQSILSLRPRVMLMTVWRSGTHWLGDMISAMTGDPWKYRPLNKVKDYLGETIKLLSDGRPEEILVQHLSNISPEALLKHTYSLRFKIIFLYRDLRDILASNVNMRKYREGYREGLPPFPDMSKTDILKWDLETYGTLFRDVLPKWVETEHTNLLRIRYEDLSRDTLLILNEIANFLDLNIEQNKLDEIVKKYSFEMRSKRQKGIENKTAHNRKGIIGDYVNQFTIEDQIMIKNILGDTLTKLGYT